MTIKPVKIDVKKYAKQLYAILKKAYAIVDSDK